VHDRKCLVSGKWYGRSAVAPGDGGPVERAAHARLDRFNRTCPATDEVIKVAEEYWKEAAESLRDFQEE
jgi:hypothetical protein